MSADDPQQHLDQSAETPSITPSIIAWRKHRHVQWSFVCFGLGAFIVFIAGVAA